MSASSVEPLSQLREWCAHLDALIASDAKGLVPPADQLAIENTIAAGFAVLAGEVTPTPTTDEPERSIMAKDLRMTTDLVLRALQSHA